MQMILIFFLKEGECWYLRNEIKRELDRRGWSVLKLSRESKVRYPSLTNFLNKGKNISTENLQKVLNILNLKIMKKQTGSRIPDYENLLKNFDGEKLINFETEMEISETDFANYLFGILVRNAANYLQKEIKGYQLSYGDIYDKFVQKITVKGKTVLDIPLSLQKREFIRIAEVYFSELEKRAFSILVIFNYPENIDREYIETQFLVGLFSAAELEPAKTDQDDQ